MACQRLCCAVCACACFLSKTGQCCQEELGTVVFPCHPYTCYKSICCWAAGEKKSCRVLRRLHPQAGYGAQCSSPLGGSPCPSMLWDQSLALSTRSVLVTQMHTLQMSSMMVVLLHLVVLVEKLRISPCVPLAMSRSLFLSSLMLRPNHSS